MNEELVKSIWESYGGDKAGSFESFKNQVGSSEDLQKQIWESYGGDQAGTFDSFQEQVFGLPSQKTEDNVIDKGGPAQPQKTPTEDPSEFTFDLDPLEGFQQNQEQIPDPLDPNYDPTAQKREENEEMVAGYFDQNFNRTDIDPLEYGKSVVKDYDKKVENFSNNEAIANVEMGSVALNQFKKHNETFGKKVTEQITSELGEDALGIIDDYIQKIKSNKQEEAKALIQQNPDLFQNELTEKYLQFTQNEVKYNIDQQELINNNPEYIEYQKDKLNRQKEVDLGEEDTVSDNPVTRFPYRMIGRTIQDAGAVLGSPSARDFGRSLVEAYPSKSSSQGRVKEYYKDTDQYRIVYTDDNYDEVSMVRDKETGFIVPLQEVPPIEELEKSASGGKTRTNYDAFGTMVGDVMFDLIPQVLVMKGVGLPLRAAGLPSRMAYGLGTIAGAGLQVQNELYEEALKQPNLTEEEADVFRYVTGAFIGAAALFNPMEAKLATGTVANAFKKNVGKYLSGNMTLKDLSLQVLNDIYKAPIKEALEENIQDSVVEPAVKDFYNENKNTDFDTQVTSDDVKETTYISAVVGLLGDVPNLKVSKLPYATSALEKAIEDPQLMESYLKGLEETAPEQAVKIRETWEKVTKDLNSLEGYNSREKAEIAKHIIDINKTKEQIASIDNEKIRETKYKELDELEQGLDNLINKTEDDGQTDEQQQEDEPPTEEISEEADQETPADDIRPRDGEDSTREQSEESAVGDELTDEEVQATVAEQREANVGSEVSYQGVKGKLVETDEGFGVDTGTDVIPIEGALSSSSNEDLGLTVERQPSEFEIDEGVAEAGEVETDFETNTVRAYGKEYTYDSVNTNEDGDVISVTLIDTDGNKRTVRNEDIVSEIETQKLIYESENSGQPITEQTIQQAEQETGIGEVEETQSKGQDEANQTPTGQFNSETQQKRQRLNEVESTLSDWAELIDEELIELSETDPTFANMDNSFTRAFDDRGVDRRANSPARKRNAATLFQAFQRLPKAVKERLGEETVNEINELLSEWKATSSELTPSKIRQGRQRAQREEAEQLRQQRQEQEGQLRERLKDQTNEQEKEQDEEPMLEGVRGRGDEVVEGQEGTELRTEEGQEEEVTETEQQEQEPEAEPTVEEELTEEEKEVDKLVDDILDSFFDDVNPASRMEEGLWTQAEVNNRDRSAKGKKVDKRTKLPRTKLGKILKRLIPILGPNNIDVIWHEGKDSMMNAIAEINNGEVVSAGGFVRKRENGSYEMHLYSGAKDNTALHELFHPLLVDVIKSDSELFTNFLQSILNSRSKSAEAAKEFIRNNYSEDLTEIQKEELLTEALANQAMEAMMEATKSEPFIKRLIAKMLRALGLSPQSAKITVDELLAESSDFVSLGNAVGRALANRAVILPSRTRPESEIKKFATEQSLEDIRMSRHGATITDPEKEFEGSGGEQNFERWKGDNREVSGEEIGEVKTGEPVVVRAYHGTTHNFFIFEGSRKGNIEGYLGRINYFTSDFSDASRNYQSDGPDLTNRIESQADRIADQLYDDYADYDNDNELDYQRVSEDFNIPIEEIQNEEDFFEIGRKIARRRLAGDTDQVLDVYIKLNNPVVLGKQKSWVDIQEMMDVDAFIEEATESIMQSEGITREEAEEDYQFEITQEALALSGEENPIYEALEKAISDNTYDYERAPEKVSKIAERFVLDGELSLSEFEAAVREELAFVQNEDGELSASQIVADTFKNLGYDGIILDNVSQRFRNMGLFSTTSHIHVFDEYNNQIKLADGRNVTFDESTSDIRFSKQGISTEEAISRNNGNPLTQAPNGKPSKLYQSYKDLGYSDTEAKELTAQVYSDGFRDWFGDWVANQLDLLEVRSEYFEDTGKPSKYTDYPIGTLATNGSIGDVYEMVEVMVDDLTPTEDISDTEQRIVPKYVKWIKEGTIPPPIFIRDNFISDGHHRHKALQQAGIQKTKAWKLKSFNSAGSNVSKVVDENGMPLVVYHGSPDFGFNEFNVKEGRKSKSKMQLDFGSHFASNKNDAEIYRGKKGGIYYSFLSLKNPINLTKGYYSRGEYNFGSVMQVVKTLKIEKKFKNSLDNTIFTEQGDFGGKSDEVQRVFLTANMLDNFAPNKVYETLKANGFDGVLYTPYQPMGFNQFRNFSKSQIAFYPNQIKSATENVGTFSSESNDIRFSKQGTTKFTKGDTDIYYKPRTNIFTGEPTGEVELELVETSKDKRGKGSAKSALREFVNTIKEPIYLTVSPRDKETDFDKLVNLYSSLGFNMQPSGFEMIRPGRVPSVRFSKQSQPQTFFSNVQVALSNLKDKNPKQPNQWISLLTDVNKNGGIRKVNQELEWIGLEDYLKDWKRENNAKSIPADVVEQYINDNRIEITEVSKGGTKKEPFDELFSQVESNEDSISFYHRDRGMGDPPAYEAFEEDGIWNVTSEFTGQSLGDFNSKEEAIEAIKENYDSLDKDFTEEANTKYSQYTLEGGENYREVLFTLPFINFQEKVSFDEWNKNRESWGKPKGTREEYVEAMRTPRGDRKYKSSHWDESNILAHLRMNDRYLTVENPDYIDPKSIKLDFDKSFILVDKGDFYKVENKISGRTYAASYPKDRVKELGFSEQDLKDYLMTTELRRGHEDYISKTKNNRRVKTERVLFIEEIQSDWAQEGKKKGFKEEGRKIEWKNPRDVNGNKVYDSVNGDFTIIDRGEGNISLLNRDGEEIFDGKYSSVEEAKRGANEEAAQYGDGGVPQMPYKKTDQWIGMAMRRAMQMAAQEGFDRIAWVTGEQSAERYDLSKQVRYLKIEMTDEVNELFEISYLPYGEVNQTIPSVLAEDVKSDELQNYVGKEIAEKAYNGQEEFETNDLKVGGEGMKTFYNSILPKVVKKEAKRFDKKANVDVVDFGGKGATEAGKQLSVKITPKMETALESAVPLFSKQGKAGDPKTKQDFINLLFKNPSLLKKIRKNRKLAERVAKKILDDSGVSFTASELLGLSEKYFTAQKKVKDKKKKSTERAPKDFGRYLERLTSDINDAPQGVKDYVNAINKETPIKPSLTLEAMDYMSDQLIRGVNTLKDVDRVLQIIDGRLSKIIGDPGDRNGWELLALRKLAYRASLLEGKAGEKKAAEIEVKVGSIATDYGTGILALRVFKDSDTLVSVMYNQILHKDKQKRRKKSEASNQSPDEHVDDFINSIKPDNETVEDFKKRVVELLEKEEQTKRRRRPTKPRKRKPKTESQKKAQEALDNFKKKMRDAQGFAGSLGNPAFFEAAVELMKYAYYTAKGNIEIAINLFNERSEEFNLNITAEELIATDEFTSLSEDIDRDLEKEREKTQKQTIKRFVDRINNPEKSAGSKELNLLADALKKVKQRKKKTKSNRSVVDDIKKNSLQLSELLQARELIEHDGDMDPADRATALNGIDEAIELLTGAAINNNNLRREIKEGIKGIKNTIAELAEDYYTTKGIKKSLIEEIISKTGLPKNEAKKYEEQIKQAFDEIIADELKKKADKELRKIYNRDINAAEEKIKELKAKKSEIAKSDLPRKQITDQLRELQNQIKSLETALKSAKRRIKSALKKQPTVSTLLDTVKNGGLNDESITYLFSDLYGLNEMTPEDINELKSLVADYESKKREYDKNQAVEKIIEFLRDKGKRMSKPEISLSLFMEYAYMNMLSSPLTPFAALGGGIEVFLSKYAVPDVFMAVGTAIRKGDPQVIQSFFKSYSSGLKSLGQIGPDIMKILFYGKAGSMILDTDRRLLGREKIIAEYIQDKIDKSITLLKSRNLVKKAAGLGIFLSASIPFTQIILNRGLIAADAINKSFMVPYLRNRIALYEVLDTYYDKSSMNLVKEVDKLIGKDNSLLRAVAEDAAEATDSDGNPLTGKALKKYKQTRYHQLLPEFTNEMINKNANAAAEEINMQGLVYGTTVGRLANWFVDTKTDLANNGGLAGKIGASLMTIVFPFARLAGISFSLVKGFTLLNLLEFGTNERGNLKVGLRRNKQIRSRYVKEDIPLSSYESKIVYINAVAPTMVGMTLAALLFGLEFDDEDNEVKIRLRDRNWRITGGEISYSKSKSLNGHEKFAIQRWDDKQGKWLTVYNYTNNPLGVALSPLGALSDDLYTNPQADDGVAFEPAIMTGFVKSAVGFATEFGWAQALDGVGNILGTLGLQEERGVFTDAERQFDINTERTMRNITRQIMPGGALGSFIDKQLVNLELKKPKKATMLNVPESINNATVQFLQPAFDVAAGNAMFSMAFPDTKLDPYGQPMEYSLNNKAILDEAERGLSTILDNPQKERPEYVKALQKFEKANKIKLYYSPKSFYKEIDNIKIDVIENMPKSFQMDVQQRVSLNIKELATEHLKEIKKAKDWSQMMDIQERLMSHAKQHALVEAIYDMVGNQREFKADLEDFRKYPRETDYSSELGFSKYKNKVGRKKKTTREFVYSFNKLKDYLVENNLQIKDGELVKKKY